ncbi:hypothetical protein LMG26842_02887 [Achromobacter dolens]|uniref:phage virion morphogenesis protein n=1 Tax=Achromobacter dolens TaxID=1287738 RepID=UPI0014686DAF|nr:phage virion morphogenesis protein [Achromobacter dolens]CAB3851934.1 hypothetical protein LMG26842_02887 [Achromobacter dolens]
MVQATIHYEGQRGLDAALSRLAALGRSPRPIFKAIANYGESSTRLRFERQRGPDGAAWKPSRRVQKSGGQTLVKSRRLLRSITNVYGDTYAAWGSNVAYARIHQQGGEINRAPYSTRIRLRTDARGNLARQPGNRKLAVFARDSHKRARTSWHEVRAYKIRMPARPFLGVNSEDLWAMGRLTVQTIQAAEGGGGAR